VLVDDNAILAVIDYELLRMGFIRGEKPVPYAGCSTTRVKCYRTKYSEAVSLQMVTLDHKLYLFVRYPNCGIVNESRLGVDYFELDDPKLIDNAVSALEKSGATKMGQSG